MVGRRWVRVLVLAGLLLAGVAGGVAATLDDPRTAPPADGDSGARPAEYDAPPAGPPEIDTTTTRIRVHPNGSATWTVEIRTRLTNETDVDDYRRFQERFDADTGRYLGPFRERMTDLVEKAGNVTGRPMEARSFAASTRIQQAPRRWGIVEYSFHWEGFAATRDGALAVGDVFESGYYLTDGDSLVVEAPAGYRLEDPRPAPERRDAGSVRWVGPIDFADRRPSVRLVEGASTTGGAGTTADGDGEPTDPGAGNQGGDGLAPLLGGAVLLVLAGGSYVVLSRRGGTAGEADPGDTADTGDAREGRTGEASDGEGDDSTPELVTNEEQVVDLLASNDGRMRQADIADRLDWSAPKTSRVLSDMAEEGTIEKLRLGNENIIDLVDDEE